MTEQNISLNVNTAASTGATHNTKTTTKQNSKKEPINMGQTKTKNTNQKQVLTEPQRPKPEGIKDVKVNYGETLFDIATKYHVSIKDVLKANPGLHQDKIREGQTLKTPYVSDKKWNAYVNAKDKYEAQELAELEAKWAQEKVEQKEQEAKTVKQKTELAQAKIQEANDLKFNKEYSFRIDAKSGDIIVTLKANKELGDIKSDFKLPPKHLTEKNPSIKQKYEPGIILDIDNAVRRADWDDAEAKKGDSFILDPRVFNPSKNFFEKLFD